MKCSAVVNETCKHGHAYSYGCLGVGVPVCVRDDRVFDEEKKVVTRQRWPVGWLEKLKKEQAAHGIKGES